MAFNVTQIEDDEELLRRVPAQSSCYSTDPVSGKLKISSTAFNDPARQPSVDRRALKASLEDAKLNPTDGLLELVASEVRQIKLQIVDKGKPTEQLHQVDVVHRPVDEGNDKGLPPNEAHSQIECAPQVGSARFDKLKEHLARLAEKRGWLIAPQSPTQTGGAPSA